MEIAFTFESTVEGSVMVMEFLMIESKPACQPDHGIQPVESIEEETATWPYQRDAKAWLTS